MASTIQKNKLFYPDERIVSFLSKYYKNQGNRDKRALDAGFGSGRHLALLHDFDFVVHGIDYSEEIVDLAKIEFSDWGFDLRCADISNNDYQKDFFDVVLCYGAIFLRTPSEMEADISNIYNLLNYGGKMIINFRSKNNWFYGYGEQIEKNTYILDERAKAYNKMTYTFLDEDEAEQMLKKSGFSINNYEFYELNKNKATELHSWHVFWVEK